MSIGERTGRKPFPWGTIIVAVIVVFGVGGYAFNHIRNARIAASTVVARVNGEPIYKSDINRGMPSDSFSDTLDDLKDSKLSRIVSQIALRQFLSKHDVRVREELVTKEIKKLEQNPPSQGCACCTYPSLDAYLSTMGYTRDDLRMDIRNSIGLSDYARTSWRKSHQDKTEVLKEIGAQSKTIRARYVNAWQIFFNTFQQPGFDANPDKIRASASRKAQNAWDRLQAGESFEAVAKSVSEDMTSKRRGGTLGFIDRSSYGQEFDDMISKLKPGETSKPFESSWGYHVIKWKPMSDSDIVKFCESYFVEKELKSIYSQIMKNAKVERPGSPDGGG